MGKDKSSKHSDALDVLIDLIPDPVVVIDSSRRIVTVNNMITDLTSYKKEQFEVGGEDTWIKIPESS